MKNLKVIKVDQYGIEFDNGVKLYSNHEQDCCEHHYLSFDNITLSDFEGLEFDISDNTFFNRIEGYGIELVPIHGHSIKIAGYASNNGYYSSNLSLVLENGEGFYQSFNITECQDY